MPVPNLELDAELVPNLKGTVLINRKNKGYRPWGSGVLTVGISNRVIDHPFVQKNNKKHRLNALIMYDNIK